MQKIVINKCWGGFGLSYKGVMKYAENKGIKLYAFIDKRDENGHLRLQADKDKFEPFNGQKDAFIVYYATQPLKDGMYKPNSYFSDRSIERNDPALIKTIEELGCTVNGKYAKLETIEIPDGVEYEIDEYDGMETIHEKHKSWG